MNEDREPLVTIVVPTFTNYETARESPKRRLFRSIRSIINQPYQNVEILVCDDGTPLYYGKDIISETVKELKLELTTDGKMTIKHLKWEHRGQAYVLNDGFAAARGDYVMDLNDDDLLMHDFLSEGVKFMEAPQNKDTGFLYSDYVSTTNFETYPEAMPKPLPWNQKMLKDRQICPVIGLFRAYWAKKIKWDTTLDHNEDWDYLLRFAQAGGKADYIPGLYSFIVFLHSQQKSVADNIGVAQSEDIIRKRVAAGYYD